MAIVFDDEAGSSTQPAAPSGKVVFDDENGPKWSDLPGNIVPDAEAVGKNAVGQAARLARGIDDLPADALATGAGEFKGKNPFDPETSPLAQDAATVGSTLLNTVKGIPEQIGNLFSKKSLIEHPVQNALTAGSLVAPFVGGGEVPEEAAPKVETPLPEKVAQAVPVSGPDKELPVIAPGAKTGAPHALFAYNDQFGPGGAARSIYNVFGDPEHPAIKAVGHGSSVTPDILEKNGIPITGREPGSAKYEPISTKSAPAEPLVPMGGKETPGTPPSRLPPDPNAPKPAAPTAAKPDPLQDVKDFLKRTQGKIESVPGIGEKARNYVKNEVADFRAKDIGMRDPMIRSLDPKNPIEAIKKAEDLMSYAAGKGYFKAGLSDVARRDAIESTIKETGKNIGAVRSIGSQRAAPPVDAIREAIKTGLNDEYGGKAGREIKTVLGDYDRMVKQDPTFEGLSKVATYLNSEKKTFNKIGQNEGPTIDAANIIGRMNNEALRKVLTPEEDKFYTQNLRDFGAHKKLETMVGSSGRRAMTGRGAPGGALSAVWQQLWDRGGYRAAGNIADRFARSTKSVKTMPEFFEELAHHAGDELDDTIHAMSKGGVVPDDVKRWVGARNC